MTLKEQYKDLIVKKLFLSKDDLTVTEKGIIDTGFELFEEKMEDIKLLNDEIKRISIENKNLKAFYKKD